MYKNPSFQQRVQLDPIDRIVKQPYRHVSRIRNVLVQFQCRGFGTGDASFVLSVSSRRGNPSGGHKDLKRVVPLAGRRGGNSTTTAAEEGGIGVCRMPKLPLKHDARTPKSNCEIATHPLPSLSLFASFLLLCRGWSSASSKSPYRASDSGTRSIILDMASPVLARVRPYVTTLPLLLDLSTNIRRKLCGVALYRRSSARSVEP